MKAGEIGRSIRVAGRALTIKLATGAGPITIVDNISFAVESQRTLCIVGESRSGKTLTARAIMRRLDPSLHIDAATRIMLDGRDLMTLDDTAMRRVRGAEVAMIFREPMSFLNPVYTVGDQVAELLVTHAGLAWRAAKTRAEDLFRLVGRDRPEPGGAHAARRNGRRAHRSATA